MSRWNNLCLTMTLPFVACPLFFLPESHATEQESRETKGTQLTEAQPQADDRPFVEFRARADNSHVFVVSGRERQGTTLRSWALGFYPEGSTLKTMFYGPGVVLSDDVFRSDKVFRVMVTEEQVRRVKFVAENVKTEGKTYIYPLQTCVSFARDIAAALGLDVGYEPSTSAADPNIFVEPQAPMILTPHQLVEYLGSHNSNEQPIRTAEQHAQRRATEIQSQSNAETHTLRTTRPPRPDDNPVGDSRRGSDPMFIPIPIPPGTRSDPDTRMTPSIPK